MANGEYISRRIAFTLSQRTRYSVGSPHAGDPFPAVVIRGPYHAPYPAAPTACSRRYDNSDHALSLFCRATRGHVPESLMSRPAVSSLQLGPGQGHGLTDPPTTRKDTSTDMMCARQTTDMDALTRAHPAGILCPPGRASTSEEPAQLHEFRHSQQWRLTAQSEAIQFVIWP